MPEERSQLIADLGTYRCPDCLGTLSLQGRSLDCTACGHVYLLVGDIPDFVGNDQPRGGRPLVRSPQGMDWLARVYESRWWYPFVLNVLGGLGSTSLQELISRVEELLGIDGNLVLDVACGPGTLGRRVVRAHQTVYGVDMSMGMLARGRRLASQEGRQNVRFARALVERLPFSNDTFDAAVCGGALHLFADPVAALQEIGRTLKANAPLVVTTFFAGQRGILRFDRVRQHASEAHHVHVFELPELEQHLAVAGFESFKPVVYGSAVVFSALKASRRDEMG